MNAITPTRAENYSEWYQQVIKAADLAENSPVRGCMVIKPRGFALWENMQAILDARFKETGHVNAYFPLLIPLSFLEKEAEHVDGFAKECAVVTHHRLHAGPDGKLRPDPASELEEPHVIRPTSETIIGHMYAKWVQSYRDLPILMNQWCNVMRWEMRTRIFLRTTEFLWQEGHTVHATSQEAVDETLRMLDVYADFAENTLAMPVICGMKTPDERFPGAVDTYTIEALMQDRRALQAGTSHFLGQNFAESSGIRFLNQQGVQETAWTTSWGVSTRLIGGLIMAHSDDDGLVVPPRIAPEHIVILPIYKTDAERESVMTFVRALAQDLKALRYADQPVRVRIDDRDLRGGDKTWQAIKQGVPIRLEVGPRDLAQGQVSMTRRDRGPKERTPLSREDFLNQAVPTLQDIQSGMLARARSFRDQHILRFDSFEAFDRYFASSGEGAPGFALAPWCADAIGHESFARLKVTPRCVPLDAGHAPRRATAGESCLFSGKPATHWVLFAKAY